jgi:ABC-2 type transport system permease protein
MTFISREDRLSRLGGEPFASVTISRGFISGFIPSIREIFARRELIVLLIGREVKAKYKDSVLGFAWSLVRPLIQLAIYYVAIGQILGAARSIPDFGIFVFIGLTLWGFFSEIVSGGTTSLLTNSGLIKKIYLPREVFPISSVGSAFVNFLMQFLVLISAVIFLSSTKPQLDWQLLYVPISILVIITFGLAISFITSALNVFLRDTQYLVEVALLLFFWLTPIVYSFTFVHGALQGSWLEQIYLSSPITISILATQKALWGAGTEGQIWPDDLHVLLAISLFVSVVVLFCAQRFFARVQGNFAQEL